MAIIKRHIVDVMIVRVIIVTTISFLFAGMVPVVASTNVASTNVASTNTTLQIAIEKLAQSNEEKSQARKMMIEANSVRKEINVTRSRSRKAIDDQVKTQLSNTASDLAIQLEQLQHRGTTLRARSHEHRKQALELFEQGFYEKWKTQISNRAPLIIDDSTTGFIAHNTIIRSVHPSVQNSVNTATPPSANNINKNADTMSILVPTLAAQSAPSDLNIRAFQISREENYFAHIEVHPAKDSTTTQGKINKPSSEPKDYNAAAIGLNKMHKWKLLLSDLSGKPITNVQIDIEGHMPGHVHGLPTQPQVTKEIAEGVYLVEGLKFQMKGWWVMQFHINNSTKESDTIKFNLVL